MSNPIRTQPERAGQHEPTSIHSIRCAVFHAASSEPQSVTRQHAFMQTTQFLHDQGMHLIAVYQGH